MSPAGSLVDSHGRTLRDLRVSLTDRCNFRCLYCLPETEAAQNFYRGHWAQMPNSKPIVQEWVPKAHLLSFEEIERVVRLAVQTGIQKIRLTGGEPLLRNDVERLVQRIAAIPGIEDLAMTTNGFLFAEKAKALRDAGLRRVSFSLDSLNRDNFRRITGRDGLDSVLASIELAQELGFEPVKVNAVVIRDINPAAPFHVLVLPRRHIATLHDLTAADDALVGHLHRVASKVATAAGHHDWSTFRRAHDSAGFFFLDTDSGTNFLLPKRAFTPTDLATVYRLLDRNGLLKAAQ